MAPSSDVGFKLGDDTKLGPSGIPYRQRPFARADCTVQSMIWSELKTKLQNFCTRNKVLLRYCKAHYVTQYSKSVMKIWHKILWTFHLGYLASKSCSTLEHRQYSIVQICQIQSISYTSIILDIQYIPGLNQKRTVYTDDLIWISSLILSPSNPITIFKQSSGFICFNSSQYGIF